MRSQSVSVLDVAAFDRRAIQLGLWRMIRDATDPTGYTRVPSNSAIARKLHVSQATVSRARTGAPVSGSFIAAAIRGLDLTHQDLFRERERIAA
jgi:hypothetical protein